MKKNPQRRRHFTRRRRISSILRISQIRVADLFRKKISRELRDIFLEASPRLELGVRILQTLALPLGYDAIRHFGVMPFRGYSLERETVWSLSRQPSVRTRFAGLRLHRTSLREAESRQSIARFSKILFHSHCHYFRWSGRRDSDPRLSPWQGDTLPLSHSRTRLL